MSMGIQLSLNIRTNFFLKNNGEIKNRIYIEKNTHINIGIDLQ